MERLTREALYERQTTLQEIGVEGQQKLAETSVLVVGCGGLGNAVAVYLAASGVGSISLVDFDIVSASNLHRQVFFKTEDIGKPKVKVLKAHINSISPFVKVLSHNVALSKNTVFDLIEGVDYVLDCTDSLPIKYLLNDACTMKGLPLVYGSLYKYDGYVSSFNLKLSDTTYTCNLRDVFPEMTKMKVPNCSEVGTLNSIVGIIGLMQANEIIKLVTGIGKPLVNELLIYNSLENSQFKMRIKPSVSKERIASIFEASTYFDPNCELQDEALLIAANELKERLGLREKLDEFEIISVIEDTNEQLPFKVNSKIPLSQLDMQNEVFDTQKEYVVVCKRGISSYAATLRIKEQYPELKVYSLSGGILNY